MVGGDAPPPIRDEALAPAGGADTKGLMTVRGPPVGLNQRWRLYRYDGVNEDIFKMHTDGDWPGSDLDASGTRAQRRHRKPSGEPRRR